MGKTRVKKTKLKQRLKELSDDLQKNLEQSVEQSKNEMLQDAELFQIDTHGKDTKRQKKVKDPAVWSKKIKADKLSKHEQKAIKKFTTKTTTVTKVSSKTTTIKSMWGADDAQSKIAKLDDFVKPAAVKKKASLKRVPSTKHQVKAVEVAASGQSYHPAHEDHQDSLAEAVAHEMDRQARHKGKYAPLTNGLSEDSFKYVKNVADSEEEEDDEEEVDEEDDTTAEDSTPVKIGNKLTRAQRNKQSRVRQQEFELVQQRKEKNLKKEINTAKHIVDQLVKKEKLDEKRRRQIKSMKEEKLLEEPEVKIGAKKRKLGRPVPVALSDELQGNLRSLRPKGNLLLERYDSFHKRNLMEVGGKKPKRSKKSWKYVETK